MTLRAGHFGLVVGSTAMTHTWPAVAEWVRWRRDEGALPETVVPAEEVQQTRAPRANQGASALAAATEFSIGATRLVVGTARKAARVAQGLVTEAPAQLPRLARIEQLDPSTRISLGQLLDEQARKSPTDICFLFGDRAVRQHEVKHRVDSVRQGPDRGRHPAQRPRRRADEHPAQRVHRRRRR